MATRSLSHPHWDDEADDPLSSRIVRFPDRAAEPAPDADDGAARLGGAMRPRHRRARQATRPDSVPRYLVTAGAVLLAVLALWYLLVQLGQLGQRTPATPAAATVGAPPAPAPAGPGQSLPAAAPASGEGPLRATSRVLEPSYTVQPGDTLGSIAAKFGTSVEALQSINNLADRNVLSVGQKLVIPNQE